MSGEEAYSPSELAGQIALALGIKNVSSDRSNYNTITLGDDTTANVRISNHYAHAVNFTIRGKSGDVNIGFVIKNDNSSFKANDSANYIEFVYFGDKTMGAARQKAIVDGIAHLVETGDFSQISKPDRINSSGAFRAKEKGVRFSIVGQRGARSDAKKMQNLIAAQELERKGNTPQSIKMATGWERRASGDWVCEVPDWGLSKEGAKNIEATILSEFPNYSTNPQVIENTEHKETIATFKLKDCLSAKDYDRLTTAYRFALPMKINLYAENSSVLGYADGVDIYLNALALMDKDCRIGQTLDYAIKETFLHELQHNIQDYEGYNYGDIKTILRNDAKYRKLADKWIETGSEEDEYAMRVRELELYERIVNEVESRNVGSRMGMTDEQRRSSLLAETEDTLRSKQFIPKPAIRFSVRPRLSAKGKKDVPLRKRKNIPQYAGGRVVGMETLSSDLRTNAARLWNDIFLYHGAEISDALAKSNGNEVVFASEHTGNVYVYRVDKDFSVDIIDGRKGTKKENNKLLEEYGINADTGEVRTAMQGDGASARGNRNRVGDSGTFRTGVNGTDRVHGGLESERQTDGRLLESDLAEQDASNSSGSTQGSSSERGAARVESVDGLRMRVRRESKSGKPIPKQSRSIKQRFVNYVWYVYEQTVNMNHTLGEFYKRVNDLRKANGEKELGVNLDLAHLASNMRGRAAGLANDFSRRYCKPLAEEFEALIKQVSLTRGVPEAKAKRMIDAYLLAYGYENRVLTGKYSDKEAKAKHEEHWAKARAAERAFEQVIAPQRPEITEWTNPITGVTTYWLNLDGVADELAMISLSAETSFCSSLIMLT